MATARIMIVEDEVIVAMELESKLSTLGYDVIGTVQTGEDAIAQAQELRPDLVVMDIQLAGNIDGVEAADRIWKSCRIPVVFLTAHSDERTLQRAKLSEPFGYLVKPFEAAGLRTAIEVSLHKHRQEMKEGELDSLFSSVVSRVGGAVILADADGRVRRMNSLAETLTGWNSEDALGKAVADVCILKALQQGDPDFAFPAFACSDEPLVHKAEYLLIARDGSEIPVTYSVMPVCDSAGEGEGVIVVFHENGEILQEKSDWFSHAANLRMTAALCQADGDLKLAESYFQRALAILEKKLGHDHPKVSGLSKDLGAVCSHTGHDREALILALRAPRPVRSSEAAADGELPQ